MGIWWSGILLTSRSNCGEPCAGNLHARFLEELISIVKSLEGEINLLMSLENDETLTKRIHKEYAEYLDQAGVPYRNDQNGFFVFIPLKNIKRSFTHVCDAFSGKVLLADYCGNCYTGIRLANRVAKKIREQCPEYTIDVEHYGASYEIVVWSY